MFSGIVEGVASVRQITEAFHGGTLVIAPEYVVKEPRLGESIAINGVCLTLVKAEESTWHFDLVSETLKQTTLSSLKPGSLVNVERALCYGGRIGGHLIEGHVEHKGVIRKIIKEGESIYCEITVSQEASSFLIAKGSVAIDGMSITVMEVEDYSFSVMFIPHTIEKTIVCNYKEGRMVNLEVDRLARYINNFLEKRCE